MAEALTRQQIADQADIHAVPPAHARKALLDRSFGLPSRLYGWTVALYLGFVAVMGLGFANPEMILPVAIFALFIVAFFGVPMIWTRLAPETPVRAKSWDRFRREGIITAFGRTSARDASVQVLILPVLIFVWGMCAVTIAALV